VVEIAAMDLVLTPHFTLAELTKVGSHVRIDNTPSEDVVAKLRRVADKCEQARAIWATPVNVSYGYRCPALNEAVGGSETSAHMLGLAADLIPDGIGLRAAWDALVADPSFMVDVDQLIIERGCVHFGLAVPLHNNIPRHELRLDATVDGVRGYPLYGHWTPQGVKRGE
jgi:zinc D-Ala-D-Ala carboxypeptidase